MAILKFRIYWEEDDTVYRDVAIQHTQTFHDFFLAILKSYDFDSKHKATFYRSNDQWQRGREISLEKYDKPYKAEPLIMGDVQIGSEIKDPNQKFIFEYDFNKNWQFLIELIQVEKEENSKVNYPTVVKSSGPAPSQYGTKGIVDSRLAEMEEKYDLRPEAMADGFGEEGEESDEPMEEEESGSSEEANDGY